MLARKQYDSNFKKMVVAKGRKIGNISAAARQYGLAPKLVLRWAKDHRTTNLLTFVPTARDYATLEKENERLKKLYADAALEREFLRDELDKRTCG